MDNRNASVLSDQPGTSASASYGTCGTGTGVPGQSTKTDDTVPKNSTSFTYELPDRQLSPTVSDIQAAPHFREGKIQSDALEATVRALQQPWPDGEFLLRMLPAVCEALRYMGVKVHLRVIRGRNDSQEFDFDPPHAQDAPAIRIQLNRTDNIDDITVRAGQQTWVQRGFDAENFLGTCVKAIRQAYQSKTGNAPPPGCAKADLKQYVASEVKARPDEYLDADNPEVAGFVAQACRQDAGPFLQTEPQQTTLKVVSEVSSKKYRPARVGASTGRASSVTTHPEPHAQPGIHPDQGPNPLTETGQRIHQMVDSSEDVPPYCPVPDGINADPRFYNLAELVKTVQQHNERPVDADTLAAILNRVRRYGPSYHRPGAPRAASHADMMKLITPEVEREWMRALGFTDASIDRMESNAFNTGVFNPLGSLPGIVLQYMLAPMVGPRFGSWASTGAAAVASLVNPVINGLTQTVVVETLTNMRAKNGVTTEQAKNINDQEWLSSIADRLNTATSQYLTHIEHLHKQVGHYAQKYGVEMDAADPGNLAASVQALSAHLDASEQADLQLAAQRAREAETEIYKIQVEVFSSKSSLLKQFWGNFWQAIPRTLRSPVNSSLNFLKGAAPGEVSTVTRVVKASDWAVVGYQSLAALGVFALQMLAAGRDEQNKRRYTAAANIATGAFLTPQGQRRWESGQEITANDLNLQAIKASYLTPPQSLVKRTQSLVDQRLASMKARMQELEQQSKVSPFHIRPQTPGQLENGGVALLSADEQAELDMCRLLIPRLEEDLSRLKAGRFDQLDPEGFAGSMLLGHPEKFLSRMLLRSIQGKYAANNESAAQIVQRYAQAFHLGLFGSAGAIIFSKVVSASLGGSSKLSSSTLGGLMLLNAGLGGVGAYSQHAAINIKNNRRANPGMGSINQLLYAALAAPRVVMAHRSANQAVTQSNEALDRNAENNLLVEYLLQRAGDVVWF